MSQHDHLKFSLTVQTDDRKVIGCLSVFAWISEPDNPRQIHIEGQRGGNWERNGHNAVFHFSSIEIRKQFIDEARALFGNVWEVKDQRDDDPPYDAN